MILTQLQVLSPIYRRRGRTPSIAPHPQVQLSMCGYCIITDVRCWKFVICTVCQSENLKIIIGRIKINLDIQNEFF